jgi:hypothetical protein
MSTVVPMPSLLAPYLTSSWLYFTVTKNGSFNQTPIRQKVAGDVTPNEMRRVTEPKSLGYEKNPARVAAVEQLTKELEADGWEYIGTGDYWYSKRFKKR